MEINQTFKGNFKTHAQILFLIPFVYENRQLGALRNLLSSGTLFPEIFDNLMKRDFRGGIVCVTFGDWSQAKEGFMCGGREREREKRKLGLILIDFSFFFK